jgi:hypothetical protein
MPLQELVVLPYINHLHLSACQLLSARLRFSVDIVSLSEKIKWDHFMTCICFSGNLEMTVDYLEEIDKLIQLIESPIFACE